jgi:hypothetical protein
VQKGLARIMTKRFMATALCTGLITLVAHAVDDPNANVVRAPQHRPDPWIPAGAKQAPQKAASSGDALKIQVEAKLRRQFDNADVAHTGAISVEQARKSGFGYVVNHFKEIDAAQHGTISFEDIKRHLRAKGAQI